MMTNYYVDTMNVYYREPNKHMKRIKGMLKTINSKVRQIEKTSHKYLNERAYN